MSTETVAEKEQASQETVAIHALIESVGKAHRDKDATAVVAAYASDAVVFNLAPPLRSGMMTDVAQVQAWFDTWDGPIERGLGDLQITVKENLAVCHGYYSLTGSPKTAGRRISFWMRVTLCLSCKQGKWLIVHEHTSVPFYMDGSLRPAFDLEPEA